MPERRHTEDVYLPNTRSTIYLHKPLSQRVLNLGKELLDSFLRIDALGLAKQVSYSIVFAMVPTVFVLVAIASLVENYLRVPVTRNLREFILQSAPDESHDILISAVDTAIANTSALTASISGLLALLLALWAGMGGVGTLVEAVNRAYGVRNTRPWYRKRVINLIMTIALTMMIVVTVVAAFLGDRSVEWAIGAIGEKNWLVEFGELAQKVLAITATFIIQLLLYKNAPAADQMLRWTLPGAIFSTAAWILLLEFSGYIVRRIDYSSVFGAAGGFILLLYVLNFAGVILIAGAVLNGVLGQRYDRKRAADISQHPEKVRYVESGQEVKPKPFQLPGWLRRKR